MTSWVWQIMALLVAAVFLFGWFLSVIFLLWLAFSVYLFLLHRKYAMIPRPKMSSFYLGHLLDIIHQFRHKKYFGELVLKWHNECGPIFHYIMLTRVAISILDPALVKEVVMNVKLPKSSVAYRPLTKVFGKRFLGESLVTIPDYDSWKPRRSLYDPTFMKNYLKSLIPAFNECTDQFIRRLMSSADGKTYVLMNKEFANVTLNIIGKVAFGVDFSELSTEILSTKDIGNKNYAFQDILEQSLRGTIANSTRPFFKYWNPSKASAYSKSVVAVRRVGRSLIERRIQAVVNKEEVPSDILTRILKMASVEKVIDIEDLVDDFVTFFFAGQETTATMLTVSLVMMLQHPEVLQCVTDEITEVLGSRNYVLFKDIEQLSYLDQVFSESLRLIPPVPAIVKEAPEAGLELAGYHIPYKTEITVSIYALHHDPNEWMDPEKFDPGRFHPEKSKPASFSYLPFSTGHRSCIGRAFAMIEAKIIMARLLSSFRFNLQEDFDLKIYEKLTMKPCAVPCTLQN